jgi:hypothetical protein
MKEVTFGIVILAIFIFSNGCGQSPEVAMLKQRPDTDVTSSPQYNFKPFAGTVWKTKVKVALADLEQYTGKHDLNLLVPMHFDPTHSEYTSVHSMQVIAVLPPGTRLRIERLIKDNGEWGGIRVAAELVDATDSQKTVYLDEMLLAKNRFVRTGWSDSKDWGVDPDMLEKAELTGRHRVFFDPFCDRSSGRFSSQGRLQYQSLNFP